MDNINQRAPRRQTNMFNRISFPHHEESLSWELFDCIKSGKLFAKQTQNLSVSCQRNQKLFPKRSLGNLLIALLRRLIFSVYSLVYKNNTELCYLLVSWLFVVKQQIWGEFRKIRWNSSFTLNYNLKCSLLDASFNNLFKLFLQHISCQF